MVSKTQNKRHTSVFIGNTMYDIKYNIREEII
jgi:hypothetical protein